MSIKVTVRCAGVTQVHMPDATGNYGTLCGMDGDDPSAIVDQHPVPTQPGAKIDCPDCIAIWEVARSYKARDFAQQPTQRAEGE